MDIVAKISKNIINRFIQEFRKEEHRKIVHNEIIQPLLFEITEYISEQLFPFFIFAFIIFILTFIFAFVIMIMIIKKR